MSGLLDNIKGAFDETFHRREGGSVLGIDISSSTIKVVQMRKKGGQAVLETYGELALGPYAGVEAGKATKLPQDTMAQALKDLMKEAKVTTTNCGVAIPLSSSLINVIQMPDVGEKQLKEMVPIEMRKYIPVSISEVVLDWRVIPNDEKEDEETGEKKKKYDKTDILVVAIHKDTTTRFQNIVRDAGLSPTFFEIEVFSTIRAVVENATAPVMIVDFGAGTTKAYIYEGRILRESHIINRGSQDVTLALSKSMGISSEKASELKHVYGLLEGVGETNVRDTISLVLDNILAEAARIMRTYQRSKHKNITQVFLTGGGAGLKGLVEQAKGVFETEVAIADPFSKVATPAFLEGVLKEAGPEFAVSVGVALRKLEEEG